MDKETTKHRIKQMLFLLVICCVPMVIFAGCGIGECIQCGNCGDDNTRMCVYASGADKDGTEYMSCVGPAGIFGCGLNSKLWPTECVSVSRNRNGAELDGCVYFYNDCGCITSKKNTVKSEGSYTMNDVGCGWCAKNKYIESVAETTRAKQQDVILGFNCAEPQMTDSRGLNETMPRAFPNGCWCPAG